MRVMREVGYKSPHGRNQKAKHRRQRPQPRLRLRRRSRNPVVLPERRKRLPAGCPRPDSHHGGPGAKHRVRLAFRSSMAAMSALAFSVRRARAAVRTSRNIPLASMVARQTRRPRSKRERQSKQAFSFFDSITGQERPRGGADRSTPSHSRSQTSSASGEPHARRASSLHVPHLLDVPNTKFHRLDS